MSTAFRVTAAPFASHASIPHEYTCEGANVSPALEWAEVPDGTATIALIMDDPDAPGGTFTHWVLFNLPPDAMRLPRAVDVHTEFADRAPSPCEGENDFGDVGYGGPCPPPGDAAHDYVFHLYALDTALDLDDGAPKAEVLRAMEGHVLADAQRVGTYKR